LKETEADKSEEERAGYEGSTFAAKTMKWENQE